MIQMHVSIKSYQFSDKTGMKPAAADCWNLIATIALAPVRGSSAMVNRRAGHAHDAAVRHTAGLFSRSSYGPAGGRCALLAESLTRYTPSEPVPT